MRDYVGVPNMDTARQTESPGAAAAVKGKTKNGAKGKPEKGATETGDGVIRSLGGEVEMRLNAMLNQGVFPTQPPPGSGKTPTGKDGGQSFS